MKNNEENTTQDEMKSVSQRRGAKAAVDIAEIAMFAALMVAGAFIRIPWPFVPLTFQTAIAVLAGLLLGAKKGAAAMAVYAFMGLIGIPVFSSGGGFSYIFMPSFGYIIGFIGAAAAGGFVAGCGNSQRLVRMLTAAICALLVNYAVGIAYFIAVWEFNGYEGLWAAVVDYNLIYIPKDLILSVLAAIVAWRVRPVIRKFKSARK